MFENSLNYHSPISYYYILEIFPGVINKKIFHIYVCALYGDEEGGDEPCNYVISTKNTANDFKSIIRTEIEAIHLLFRHNLG